MHSSTKVLLSFAMALRFQKEGDNVRVSYYSSIRAAANFKQDVFSWLIWYSHGLC